MSMIARLADTHKPIRLADRPRKARRPRPITRPRPRPSVNPRLQWPAWTDESMWATSELVMPEGELRAWEAVPEDTRDHAVPFVPEEFEAAWWAGFNLGIEGEHPAPPEHYSNSQRFWFSCGRLTGFMVSPDGIAWTADMDACRDQIVRDVHHAELVEAGGIDFARSFV